MIKSEGVQYTSAVRPYLIVLLYSLWVLMSCGQINRKDQKDEAAQEVNRLIDEAGESKNLENDTAVFSLSEKGSNLFTFDDTGILAVNQGQIELNLKEGNKGETYNLSVSVSGTVVFSKSGLQGISKVFFKDNWLLFTVYTFFSEDGVNKGEAILLNVNRQNDALLFKRPLTKTCNPAFYREKFYFVDGLSIIETDTSLDKVRILPLFYSDDNSYENGYLDTYLICGLSVNEKTDSLQIEFTPSKSEVGCQIYEGAIGDGESLISITH